MQPCKALFLLVDALRYDVLADLEDAAFIAPNMARLAKRGLLRKCVTNAQSTQFVLPALFTQSYPLDYGGYNNGIRNRPKSFVESLREAGYSTHLMSSSNQIGITMGYDRGFDTIRTTTDYRTLLEQRISHTLSYELKLFRLGERSESEIIDFVQRELGTLCEKIREGIERHDKSLWPTTLNRINNTVGSRCSAEIDLLMRDPIAVIGKLERVPPGVYWRFLGDKSVDGISLFVARAKAGLSHRLRRWAAYRWWFPFLISGHYQVKLGEIMDALIDYVEGAREESWYIHMHAMDVHDCRYVDRIGHVVSRFIFFPRWLWGRMVGRTRRRWTYDSAVMYVDRQLGRLFQALEKTGQMENTVIVITGDHGFDYALSPRKKKDVALRTYREDIEVPMVLFSGGNTLVASEDGMIDSMGLCASFLDAIGIDQYQSFKGVSLFRGGRDAVISENAGSGNADITRRDLYFTITTPKRKLMTRLVGDELQLLCFYNLVSDPDEINNQVGCTECGAEVKSLVEILLRERREIFEIRGATLNIENCQWKIVV